MRALLFEIVYIVVEPNLCALDGRGGGGGRKRADAFAPASRGGVSGYNCQARKKGENRPVV